MKKRASQPVDSFADLIGHALADYAPSGSGHSARTHSANAVDTVCVGTATTAGTSYGWAASRAASRPA